MGASRAQGCLQWLRRSPARSAARAALAAAALLLLRHLTRAPPTVQGGFSTFRNGATLYSQRGVCARGLGFSTQPTKLRRAVSCARISQNATKGTLQVVFGGCARNVAGGVTAFKSVIEEIGAGRGYAVHIYEDGSTDGTRGALMDWAALDPRVALFLAEVPPWTSSRLSVLSLCRGTLLHEALKLQPPRGLSALKRPRRNAPVYAVLDVDCDHRGLLTADAFWQAAALLRLKRKSDEPKFDAVFGSGSPYYYDLWALRSKTLGLDYDCIFVPEDAEETHCRHWRVKIDPKAPLIPVDSAFNGVAIYDVAALAAAHCDYEDRPPTCEHVAFHACLGAKGLRLAISPQLQQGCGAEHVDRFTSELHTANVRENGTVDVRHAPG
ncbi:hypothetical protein M885DRAFT_524696 [Pelagophyceae sp. CCMP2097]|nr:hypothetical protein M885DRAFT_524696 [Pelagophyceae sp. CCMP2097]